MIAALLQLLRETRELAELALLRAALALVTWLASLVGAELPPPSRVATAWVH